MPHEQHAVAIREKKDGDSFYSLASFAPDLHRPCPGTCGGAGKDGIPSLLYIHLLSEYIQYSGCSWCQHPSAICEWCVIDPHAANEDNGSNDGNLFRGGVLQMIRMNRDSVTGTCSCQGFASSTECCWCLGTLIDDAWQYPPTDCNGIAAQIPDFPEQFEGQLYRGGLFCTDYFGLHLWTFFIGSASCPKGCPDADSNYDSEGCGLDCQGGLSDPSCVCSIDWYMIYVKVNIVEPPHENGKPQGLYHLLFHIIPDSNGQLCGSYNTPAPLTLIIDEETEPH